MHPGSTNTPALYTQTVADCNLDTKPITLAAWSALSSDELARVVGVQTPSVTLEYAQDYTWQFMWLPTEDIRCANDDGEEPEGGWHNAYLMHIENDRLAIANGSPEYAGRDDWLRTHWGNNTAIYPLYVVIDTDVQGQGQYRLWDGHRRLASAFFYGLNEVAILLGTEKPRQSASTSTHA